MRRGKRRRRWPRRGSKTCILVGTGRGRRGGGWGRGAGRLLAPLVLRLSTNPWELKNISNKMILPNLSLALASNNSC